MHHFPHPIDLNFQSYWQPIKVITYQPGMTTVQAVHRNLGEVKNHLNEKLEKVRSQPWAKPLSKALATTGSLLGRIEDFVPGGMLIGGALSFGATLLNTTAPKFDLLTGLAEEETGIRQDMDRIFTEVKSSKKEVFEEIQKTKAIIVDTEFKVRPVITEHKHTHYCLPERY